MVYAHQQEFDGPTPVSRLDLLHALVGEGTVCIDTYHKNTPDKAKWQGRYYSDKAPGTVALALVPFTVAAGVLWAAGDDLNSHLGWVYSSWFACAGSLAVIAALGGVALFAWLSRYVPPRWALLTVLALFLGAAPLPYATMMFSHALVVGLLSIALWAIHKNAECGMRSAECRLGERRMTRWFKANRWSLLAGHACGWALASEYSSGLVVVGLFIWLVASGWRRAIPFCLAALPPLLLIPAYSWACFGNPFILPYSLQASFPAMQEGVYAIKWPDPDTAFKLLFTPVRGLFFWTPFFVMAGFGYWQLVRKSRGLFWLMYLVPLLQILVISGRTWDWPAGPTLGPRLLAPMIPFLALPCALGLARWPLLGTTLAVYSIAITTLATLTDACPTLYHRGNPLVELHLVRLLNGEFSPNLGMALGLPPYVSVALYYAVLVGGAVWLWRQLPAAGEQRNASTRND